MWNTLTAVANSQFLPTDEFTEFAVKNEEKYRIDMSDPKHPEVGNFWVDALLKDFRAAFPELCERTRKEKIEQFKNGALRLSDFGARG
jgi:hypothetical protein